MPQSRPIAIVPARMGSARLRGKPLVDLGGAPLIQRVCENLEASGLFGRIVVATDADEVASRVTGCGYGAVLTDPRHPSGTDRVAEATRLLGLPPEAIVVNVQGDEPFVAAEGLAALLGAIAPGDSHVATPVEAIGEREDPSDPNLVKVALGTGDRALYFSRAPIPFVRDPDPEAPPTYLRHVGVYAYSVATLARLTVLPEHTLERVERLEQLRWLAHGEQISCVVVEPSPRGIDTEDDRLRADAHYRQHVSHP